MDTPKLIRSSLHDADPEVRERISYLDWFDMDQATNHINQFGSKTGERILVRTHATHNAYVTGRYEDMADPPVHATPHWGLPHLAKRYLTADIYQGLPNSLAFLSIFTAHPEQRYFRDECLIDHVHDQTSGFRLAAAEVACPIQHFETNLQPERNKHLATWLYLRTARLDQPPFFAAIDDRFKEWLDSRMQIGESARAKLNFSSLLNPRL